MRKFILTILASMMLGMSFTSCKDMLSPESERHSYEIAGDTLYSYWGILKSLQNVAERYVILGECRGDLVDGTSYVSDSIKVLLDFDMSKATDGACRYLKVSDYYHVINSCNAYLAQVNRFRRTGTDKPYMLKEAAQVEAIRAWVYLQLVQVYGEVPFYTQPLTTTADINNYFNNPAHETANATNLADKLAPYLTEALSIEFTYGLPAYEEYKGVCHSTKCMIPVNLILGDLYLAKGDAASCRIAAEHYYNYLSGFNGANMEKGKVAAGGVLPTYYKYEAYQDESMDKPIYMNIIPKKYAGAPFNETDSVSMKKESITAIPSSTNKLWGTVLRGVNDVFGYVVEISVNTSGSDTTATTSATVAPPTPTYDRKQLAPSLAYTNLAKSQAFEYLEGSIGDGIAALEPKVDNLVGDARQYWVEDQRVTYANGTSNTEKFITKQNPLGLFSTVYPMIYRKSMVWLRFAEALNRAGMPSYAFAILKDGICDNPHWFPIEEAYDYAVRDTAFWCEYKIADDEKTYRFPDDDSNYSSSDELKTAFETYVTESGIDVNTGTNYWNALSFENWTNDDSEAFLFYIDKRHQEKAKSFNFSHNTANSFEGTLTVYSVPTRSKLREMNFYTLEPMAGGCAMGIHARGCGMLGEVHRRESVYDYVRIIQKRYAEEHGGQIISREDIYNGAIDADIQNYIEDLIVDEEALELAFEGNRFFDLMRVSMRRSDPSYLAKRVAMRSGTFDFALYNKLLNQRNWFFPLPAR